MSVGHNLIANELIEFINVDLYPLVSGGWPFCWTLNLLEEMRTKGVTCIWKTGSCDGSWFPCGGACCISAGC